MARKIRQIHRTSTGSIERVRLNVAEYDIYPLARLSCKIQYDIDKHRHHDDTHQYTRIARFNERDQGNYPFTGVKIILARAVERRPPTGVGALEQIIATGKGATDREGAYIQQKTKE